MCTWNNILRKLISSHWGASPHTLRISTRTLCYSAADYACPVWSRSAYAHRLDPALNDSCHIITGCLKSTNTNCLYLLAGIAPPDIRREVASRRKRQKARHDPSHMLYRSEAVNQRLKSRKSFLHNTPPLNMPSEEMRIEQWKNRLRECPLKPDFNIEPAKVLAPGHQVPWKDWRCLNRLRTGTVKTRSTLAKWKFHNGPTLCKCGTADDTAAHLLLYSWFNESSDGFVEDSSSQHKQRPLSLIRRNVLQNSRLTKILFHALPHCKANSTL